MLAAAAGGSRGVDRAGLAAAILAAAAAVSGRR
jgi:hypothetical protein